MAFLRPNTQLPLLLLLLLALLLPSQASPTKNSRLLGVKVKKWYNWDSVDVPAKKWYDWQSGPPATEKRLDKRNFDDFLEPTYFDPSEDRLEWRFNRL